MSKWFGRSIATSPNSPAKLTKRKVAPEPSGYTHRPDTSATVSSRPVSSRGASSSSPTHLPLIAATRTSLQHSSTRQPYSQTEIYWATRALRSETLLVAKTTHHNEVRGILSSAETKRAREILELKREHDASHSRLEAVALGLIVSLLFLAIAVFYLLANLPRQRIPEATRWGHPHHFTIPVLSPFTSVVEAETSVIGARSIAVVIVVSGAVIYGFIRYWLDHRSTK